MGFLSCNRPRKREPGKSKKKKPMMNLEKHEYWHGLSPAAERKNWKPLPLLINYKVHRRLKAWNSNPEVATEGQREATPETAPSLEKLPAEILRMIFVMAGNLALPQASFWLAHKLRNSLSLQKALVLAQMDDNQVLSMEAAGWPFLSEQLLENLHVKGIDGKFVPKELEDRQDQQSLHTMAYLIETGAKVEDSATIYVRMLETKKITTVEAMLKLDLVSDHHAAILAIDQENPQLAIKLIECNKALTGASTIWEKANQAGYTDIIELLNAKMIQS